MIEEAKGVSAFDLIAHHTKGAEACEAYAKRAVETDGPSFKAVSADKRTSEHYAKRAQWHRDAAARIEWLIKCAAR